MPRTILHADMDAFYATVEQRDRPELRGLPVIVAGASNRGVVLTASYEARVYGVHSAMPAVHARRLCPDGAFVPPRMEHYAEVARQIRAVFLEFTPLVEPLSLDEAFLDVTESLRLFGTGLEIARQVKRRVADETQLTVSVGVGPNKMIAKIASTMSKPDGLLEVPPDQVSEFLRPLPVNQLWGVGPTTHATLRQMGITTIGELADADLEVLQRRLGSSGAALWVMAHGTDDDPVDPNRQRKSYGEEQTFERDLRDGDVLRRAIIAQAEAVARRLRADGCKGRTVTLKFKLAERIGPGKYPVVTRRLTLPDAVEDAQSIIDAALTLWDAVKRGKLVRLIGVSVSGIERAEPGQLNLFGRAESERRVALEHALDRLTARFGEDAVTRGGPPRK